jgi:predicted Zn-dependent peptidase
MFGLSDDYYSHLEAHYEALTVDDLRRVAIERVENERLSLLVVGDRSVVEPGLEELGYPIVHVDYEGGVID